MTISEEIVHLQNRIAKLWQTLAPNEYSLNHSGNTQPIELPPGMPGIIPVSTPPLPSKADALLQIWLLANAAKDAGDHSTALEAFKFYSITLQLRATDV